MLIPFSILKNVRHKAKNQHLLRSKTDYKVYVNSRKKFIQLVTFLMSDDNPTSTRPNHHRCACCTKAKFEIPEEMMTEEMKILKENLSEEEFEELMKGLM